MTVEEKPAGVELLKNLRILWICKSILFHYRYGLGFQTHTKWPLNYSSYILSTADLGGRAV